MAVSEVVGLIALALTAVQFVPQVVRLVVTEHRGGISTWFWVFVAVQGALWIAYSVSQKLVYVALVNGLVSAASALVLCKIRWPDRMLNMYVVVLGILCVVVAVTYAFVPVPIAGTVAVVLAVVAWLPQAWSAGTQSDLRGLSPWSWLLVLASSSMWWIHGYLLEDVRVQIPSSVSGVTSIWVLARIASAPRRFNRTD